MTVITSTTINFDGISSGVAQSGFTDASGAWRASNAWSFSSPNSYTDTTPTDGQITVYTGLSPAAEADMCAQVLQPFNNVAGKGDAIGVGLRLSSGGTNGYFVQPNPTTNQYYILKLSSGAISALAGPTALPMSISNGQVLACKGQVQGTQISAKFWIAGTAEPAS